MAESISVDDQILEIRDAAIVLARAAGNLSNRGLALRTEIQEVTNDYEGKLAYLLEKVQGLEEENARIGELLSRKVVVDGNEHMTWLAFISLAEDWNRYLVTRDRLALNAED